MQFRLLYRGALPANGRPEQKQAIRRALHPQLAELWRQQPLASHLPYLSESPPPGNVSLVTMVGPFSMVSLVSSKINLVAELDILLFRRAPPGSIIGHGGDLDNRLKTLLDALRVPDIGELPANDTPGANESPFHCLLEDDALVTRVTVESERLLDPGQADEVQLVVAVQTRPTLGTWGNISLMG